jgi:Domain of Unknown Function (DUF1080)
MADKDDDFDPYHKWLGIPRDQRPVTFYQLLGISPTETDREVIEDAATRQSSHVRTYQLGNHADVCQRVLNEIAQARSTMLDPAKRAAYDAKLDATRPKSRPPAEAAEAVASKDPFESSVFGAPVRPLPLPPRAKPRKPPEKAAARLVVGLAASGVVALAVLVGAAIWLRPSDPTPAPAPAAKKSEPKADPPKLIATAEKKLPLPETRKTIASPRTVEPKKSPDPIEAKKDGDGLKVEMRFWRNDMPKSATLMRKSEGLVVHGGWTGSFNGPGEYVKILCRDRDDWILEGQAVPQLAGYVHCVTGLPEGWFDLEKTTEAAWEQGGRAPIKPSVELLAEDAGICWLANVTGDLNGGEGVRVYRDEGKWLLGGVSGGLRIGGLAIVAPFGKGIDRTKFRIAELAWRPADGPIKLLDVKDGFCALTEVFGKFKAPKQQVKLMVKNGAWWIDGNDTQGDLRARVLRVSLTGNLPTISDTDAPAVKIEPAKFETPESKRPWKDRRPAPDAETLAAKQKELRLAVKPPAAGASDEDLRKYAETLLGAALATSDDAAMRYALLNEVFERTYPFGDPTISARALTTLERDFVVDALGLKSTALTKASAKAGSAAAFQALSKPIDDFVKDALEAEDLDRAEKIAAVGMIAGQKSKIPGEASASMKRLVHVRALAKSLQTYKAAEAILAKTPDDPKASTEAGQYLILVKGHWGDGLKLLARGSDAKLKALAQKDLDAPVEVDSRAALGDGWADFAERDSGKYKAQAAARAVYWYSMVLGEATPLTRLKIEKRMSDLEKLLQAQSAADDGWTTIFNGKDLVGWTSIGKREVWSAKNGVLYVAGGGDGGWLMTDKEYKNFEIKLDYKLNKLADSGITLRSPLPRDMRKGQRWDPAEAGMEIQLLDDASLPDIAKWQNTGAVYGVVPVAKVNPRPLGEWNSIHITLKGRTIKVVHNGETLIDADLNDFVKEHGTRHPGLLREGGHLGLQSSANRMEFKNIFVRTLD